MRSLRTQGGRQRRCAGGERDGPQGRPAPTVQLVRREADLNPPCMAYSQTFRRAGFHEAASLSDADPLHWLAICSASRSAARGRKPTGRAETGGKDAREAPCVARAHALPTRGSAWRTIGYVARPPAAPGDDGACACTPLGAHPLLCGMARSCHAAQYRAARLPCAVSQAGADSHARLPPAPSCGETTGARAGGKDARLACGSLTRAPCVWRGLR